MIDGVARTRMEASSADALSANQSAKASAHENMTAFSAWGE